MAAVVPDEVLVRFKPDVDEPGAGRALADLGGRQIGAIPALRVRRVKLPPGLSPDAALARLRARRDVDAAEPNMIVHAAGSVTIVDDFASPTPGVLSSTQWALDRIGATRAWQAGIPSSQGSAGIIVAIVDSGIDSRHPELAGQLVPGINILNPGVPPEDDQSYLADDPAFNGHGTFVASEVAARVGNGGMMGVAPLCRLMPVKVLDSTGSGTEADLLQGVLWAAQNGAKVINCSIGSCQADPSTNRVTCVQGSAFGAETMDLVWRMGCIVVAATGNESYGAAASFPAGYPHVVGVSATDPQDRLTWFSNYGTDTLLAAPGGTGNYACDVPQADILGASHLPASCPPTGSTLYEVAFGTSMACPIVAGAAAVLLAQDPTRTNDQVVSLLEQTADQPEGGTGWNPRYGYGRINLYRALTGQVTPTPAAAAAAWVYPNPFNPDKDRFTRIVVPGGAGQDVTVTIYDLLGHQLWMRHLSAAESSGTDLYWNSNLRWYATTADNTPVANGVYLARITVGSTSVTKKIAVAR